MCNVLCTWQQQSDIQLMLLILNMFFFGDDRKPWRKQGEDTKQMASGWIQTQASAIALQHMNCLLNPAS